MIKLKPKCYCPLIPENFETEKWVVLIGNLTGFFGYFTDDFNIKIGMTHKEMSKNLAMLMGRGSKGLLTFYMCEDEYNIYWDKLADMFPECLKGKVKRCVPAGFRGKALDENYVKAGFEAIKTNFFKKEDYNNNMNLVIANPPYGKSSSNSREILNTIHENGLADEIVCLAPPKTFWDSLPYLDSFHIVGNISSLFDTVSKETGDLLSCGIVKKEKVKDPKYTHQFDLAPITDKQRQLLKAVEKYNSTHEPFYAELMRQMTLKNKKFYPNVNEDLIFTIPIYTPHDKVHANDSADRRHNLERKPVEWRDSSSCDFGILFKDDISYKNFCNWWYKVPGMYGKSEKTFLWNSLDILAKCFGGGPSINRYPLTFPHLDWSHPWEDKEILKEIGLPEDFLEKSNDN